MLRDITRFNQRGNAAAASGELKDGRTVRAFLQECRVATPFVDQYFVPMAAAIWSSKPQSILDFPADFMIGFFANHGLMQLRDRPKWRTIVGGSRKYVNALLDPIHDRIRLGCKVESVARCRNDVVVQLTDGERENFDEVVFASHADQTLKMLADPTRAEIEILSSFPYQSNNAVLHTDTSLLPQHRRAWASWNYHIPNGGDQSASLTYDLSRLQQHPTPSPILLTLNATSDISPTKVLRTFTYSHPAYCRESIASQGRFDEVTGQNRTHFCGAYWGYGFHEDGVNSALAVARHFGIGLEACTVASMKESSRTAATSQ